jgi:hypothetical protein
MFPIRQLGAVGVITDVAPYDLPPNAVSRGVNVRFTDGKVAKAPAHRAIYSLEVGTTSITQLEPSFAFTYRSPGNADKIGVVEDDGTIHHYQNGTLDDVTQAAWAGSSSDIPFTEMTLAGVHYVNRSDMVPQRFLLSSTDYDDLEHWDATWRCRSLRAFKDYPIALNIDKGAVSTPTMIKWGDPAQWGAVSLDWDATSTTNNAGENTPGDATSGWLDGLALKDAFFIYNDTQVYRLTESLDFEVFNVKKIFDNRGIVNTNCVVEVNGLHYVFGRNDIYVHDGIGARSIVDKRVKKYIFDSIDFGAKDSFFVFHNPFLTQIEFCYRSGDDMVLLTGFDGTNKCNRGAVYDYSNDTWTFYDHPNVVGACIAGIDTFRTYAEVVTSYEETGGTFYDMESGSGEHMVIVGLHSTSDGLTSKIYGLDRIEGGLLPFAVDETATCEALVFRTGLDLDEMGEEIRAYKVMKAFYPQVEDFGGLGCFFKFSGTLFNPTNPDWDTEQAYDPSTQYKCDTRAGGRYLAWHMRCELDKDFTFSGFDADIETTGRR